MYFHMARTPSNMMPLGTIAPEFELPDTVSGDNINLNAIKGNNATLIMFICNHCPFVIHVNNGIVSLANTFKDMGVSFVAISSNDVENYPQDAPHLMKEVAKKERYPFPYLYDETQEIAKACDAACTPDFFLFDGNLKLVYRGQLDDSRPGNNIPVTGSDIHEAISAVISGKEVSNIQKPSIGCNIKWK